MTRDRDRRVRVFGLASVMLALCGVVWATSGHRADTVQLAWARAGAAATSQRAALPKPTTNQPTDPSAGSSTIVSGSTWFSDGTIAKTVPRGTRIVAYATGAAASVQYKLVLANTTSPGNPCTFTEEMVNPSIRLSTSDGFIGNTSGTAYKVGTYQVCFVDAAANNTATAPVTLIVT